MLKSPSESCLFHVSERGGISAFVPRISEQGEAVVWAIDEAHLPNYLLPRECPRVCVRANRGTPSHELLVGGSHAIYVENEWRERIERVVLYCYVFDGADFICADENAGYFHSKNLVKPLRVECISNVVKALAARNVSLQFIDALWPKSSAAQHSGLEFSCIRMRNASGVQSEQHNFN
jgi:hypothetical protein